MNAKLLIATIVGAIVFFFLGWIVYGLLLMDFFAANTVHYEGLMKEMPDLLLMIISNLVFSFMLAFVFQRWAKFTTFMQGLTGGLILGFLIAVVYDLYFLAGMNLYNYSLIVVDVLVGAVMTGLVGGVIGWVLGFRKKEAQA